MRRSGFILVLATILVVVLTACSSSDRLGKGGACNTAPFESGVEITSPIVPISALIGADGITFKTEGSVTLDLLVFEVKPYVSFGSPGNPLSPCLMVDVFNPNWEDEHKHFYVNFNKNNLFHVRVNTQEVTEFVFSRERWIAYPPGEREFVRYDYSTNTLYLDASKNRVTEFTITAEEPEPGKVLDFCATQLRQIGSGTFVSPFALGIASFQDLVNSTREDILDQFGPVEGGVVIPVAWLVGVLGPIVLAVKRRQQVSFKWAIPFSIFLAIWTCFWFAVFNAFPACWT